MNKLIEELEAVKKAYPELQAFLKSYSEDDNEWWRLDMGDMQNHFDSAIELINDCIALVKKHMGGDMCVCGHDKSWHHPSLGCSKVNDKGAVCCCTKFTPQQEQEKSCKNCGSPQEACEACSIVVGGNWSPMQTRKIMEAKAIGDMCSNFAKINERIHGLLVDRDNINKRLDALERAVGFRMREVEKRIAKLEGEMKI